MDPAPSPITTQARKKTTLNLQNIFAKPENGTSQEKSSAADTRREPVEAGKLRETWDAYAEQRKGQVAEYQILKREYRFEYPIVFVLLTNPVEETLLDNFKHEFVQFLRDHLWNGELTVTAVLQEGTQQKVIYTAKEKFEYLAEKNPFLNELKERLGLDWDF